MKGTKNENWSSTNVKKIKRKKRKVVMGRGRAIVPIDFPFLLGGNCSRIGNVVDAKKRDPTIFKHFANWGGKGAGVMATFPSL